MQRRAPLSAFAPCLPAAARTPCASRPSICGARASAGPFFASSAFGAAVAPRAAAPKAAVRMDVTVVVGENEPIESAIRRFKKDVTKSGHLFELRRRRYFETNTEKRLRKSAAARRKARMARNMRGARSRTQPARPAAPDVVTPDAPPPAPMARAPVPPAPASVPSAPRI